MVARPRREDIRLHSKTTASREYHDKNAGKPDRVLTYISPPQQYGYQSPQPPYNSGYGQPTPPPQQYGYNQVRTWIAKTRLSAVDFWGKWNRQADEL